MHADGARQNGGLGFALSDPGVMVILSRSSELEIIDNRSIPSSPTEISMLKDRLELSIRRMRLKGAARVEIRGDMRSHYGFGSGTAIRLACIEGMGLIAEREFTRSEIVALSGRGYVRSRDKHLFRWRSHPRHWRPKSRQGVHAFIQSPSTGDTAFLIAASDA